VFVVEERQRLYRVSRGQDDERFEEAFLSTTSKVSRLVVQRITPR
jgi:hypothetical protein